MTRTHRICVLPGDGIGPEVTAVAVRVLAEAGAAHGFALEVDEQLFGVIAVLEAGPVTRDLGGGATTGDVADVILGRLGETVSGGRT